MLGRLIQENVLASIARISIRKGNYNGPNRSGGGNQRSQQRLRKNVGNVTPMNEHDNPITAWFGSSLLQKDEMRFDNRHGTSPGSR
jgi:hypothetical protein